MNTFTKCITLIAVCVIVHALTFTDAKAQGASDPLAILSAQIAGAVTTLTGASQQEANQIVSTVVENLGLTPEQIELFTSYYAVQTGDDKIKIVQTKAASQSKKRLAEAEAIAREIADELDEILPPLGEIDPTDVVDNPSPSAPL